MNDSETDVKEQRSSIRREVTVTDVLINLKNKLYSRDGDRDRTRYREVVTRGTSKTSLTDSRQTWSARDFFHVA